MGHSARRGSSEACHLCFEPQHRGIRKQFGVTQEQLAAALGLSPRTVQNRESGVGLSQIEKRVSDIAKLSDLLSDYIRSATRIG